MAIQLRLELQRNPVADEVGAITAVVRPILLGTLFSLKQEMVAEVGGYDGVKLKVLSRLYRAGDGDCGICFEYAVHDALRRRDSMVLDRVDHVLSKFCRVDGSDVESILFGAEKAGAQQLIDTAKSLLTDDSLLMYGTQGRPVHLRRHIDAVAKAFRKGAVRSQLPSSISGLWKADLFVGKHDTDRWVGTTVKINPDHLEGAKGLRIGIIPQRDGDSDAPRRDDKRNLVICPLAHDGAFMEIFYSGWEVVQQFLAADAQVPKEVALFRPTHRQVARYLADRRDFPVQDVVEALKPLAQPELLEAQQRDAGVIVTRDGGHDVGAVVAPMAREIK